jgi:hypothetical protein
VLLGHGLVFELAFWGSVQDTGLTGVKGKDAIALLTSTQGYPTLELPLGKDDSRASH